MSEAFYWWRWFGTKGLQWPKAYEERLDPEQLLVPSVAAYAARVASDPVRILDVGAGPVTAIGYRMPGREISITAVDVLGRVYDRLLKRHNITPPVRTTYADAERLDQFVEAGTFDIVHARNSIDHAARPAVAIDQMVKAAKPGGYILLSHAQNEAVNESYIGLHQWNFTERDGSFVVWNKAESLDMTRLLQPVASVRTKLQGQTVFVEIRKHDLRMQALTKDA